MRNETKSRSVLIFKEYLQSEKTIEHYTYHINRFAKYFDLPSWDSILALEIIDLKEKIEDYGISLIILNGMMYVGIPILAIMRIRK
jgi:hypothetical protein